MHTDPKCLTKPAKPRARGCNTDKPKRMKKVFGKIEFLSHMLNNSSKQLADLMDHSNDMESKIDAILDNLNSTRPGISKYKITFIRAHSGGTSHRKLYNTFS